MFGKKVAVLVAFLAVFSLATLTPAEEEKPAEAEKVATIIDLSSLFVQINNEFLREGKASMLLREPVRTLEITFTKGEPSEATILGSRKKIVMQIVKQKDGKWRIQSPTMKLIAEEPGFGEFGVPFMYKMPEKPETRTEVFEIRYARPDDIRHIAEHFLSKGARIHTGPYDTLIVKGSAADIEAVGNLIKRFDVPRPTLQFKFQLIKASKDEGKAEMPEELSSLAEQFKALLKYDKFERVATGSLTTFADGRLKRLSLTSGKEAPSYSIEFKPSFSSERPGIIKMQDLHILKTARGRREVLETYSEVRTTLQIRDGETVIVGGVCTSDSARIFIITAWVKEAEAPIALDQSTPEGAWKSFQKAIKDGNFKAAWEYLSPEYKAKWVSYEKWFEAMSPHDIEYIVQYRVVRVQPVGEERAFITVERPGAATNHFRMKKIEGKWYIERWQ